jgi:hypothetical protein
VHWQYSTTLLMLLHDKPQPHHAGMYHSLYACVQRKPLLRKPISCVLSDMTLATALARVHLVGDSSCCLAEYVHTLSSGCCFCQLSGPGLCPQNHNSLRVIKVGVLGRKL